MSPENVAQPSPGNRLVPTPRQTWLMAGLLPIFIGIGVGVLVWATRGGRTAGASGLEDVTAGVIIGAVAMLVSRVVILAVLLNLPRLRR